MSYVCCCTPFSSLASLDLKLAGVKYFSVFDRSDDFVPLYFEVCNRETEREKKEGM